MAQDSKDFSKGSVARNIIGMAVPMTVAQVINLLYNIVDRMYIGHIPEESTQALTGLGLTFPIIAMVSAFALLFGQGGAPLSSISMGKGDYKRAEQIMGNSFVLLILGGISLTVIGLLFRKPILYLFGASDITFPYANAYMTIYLMGSVFVMISLGMNGYINAQGFGRTGMLTILIGAVLNIILDPIFIFVLGMGIEGAAYATVISQFASALWILLFLIGKKAAVKLKVREIKMSSGIVKEITGLGLSGFVMAFTNGAVQVVCNATLQNWGGDLYVGVMTVLNSVREIFSMPVQGLTNGAQPVISFNYGAKEYKRVREGIRFMAISCVSFTAVAWIILMIFPMPFIRIFNQDVQLLQYGVPALRVYFFGFFMMAMQFSGQSSFVALGMSKHAVFFSLLRKAFIVIPLTLLLPYIGGLGVMGVFLAEPISNFIGGTAAFTTMLMTAWRRLKREE